MSVELRPENIIGRGFTSEVYTWEPGTVLKLYHRAVLLEQVEREFKITNAVWSAGYPAPKPIDLMMLKDRPGIVLERLEGRSFYDDVRRKPWTLIGAARRLAQLHSRLHDCAAPPDLPSQRDQMEGWVRRAAGFSDAQKQEARLSFRDLPDGNVLCHGDFHPANILLSDRGPVVIDWMSGTRGHPLGDAARTSHLFQHADLPREAPAWMKLLLKASRVLLHETYLRTYLSLRRVKRADLLRWMPIQRAASDAWRSSRAITLIGPVTDSEWAQ